MKKILIFALVLTLALVSCGTVADVEISAVADAVKENVTFRDMMYEPEAQVTHDFYMVGDEVKECWQIISGTGATAEEIAVFKLDDTSKTQDVISACETRKQERADRFVDYMPDEMTIIENVQIFNQGDYVFYICADDAQGAKDTILNLFK